MRGARHTADSDWWEGGQILDTDNGKTYTLRLRVNDDTLSGPQLHQPIISYSNLGTRAMIAPPNQEQWCLPRLIDLGDFARGRIRANFARWMSFH